MQKKAQLPSSSTISLVQSVWSHFPSNDMFECRENRNLQQRLFQFLDQPGWILNETFWHFPKASKCPEWLTGAHCPISSIIPASAAASVFLASSFPLSTAQLLPTESSSILNPCSSALLTNCLKLNSACISWVPRSTHGCDELASLSVCPMARCDGLIGYHN